MIIHQACERVKKPTHFVNLRRLTFASDETHSINLFLYQELFITNTFISLYLGATPGGSDQGILKLRPVAELGIFL